MTSTLPQTDATSADYQVVVDESEALLDSVREFIPAESIVRDEPNVTDLESDKHRMLCSDTTSQYTNAENIWLAEGTDEIAIIDEIRADLESQGWSRTPSVDEQSGGTQSTDGLYVQTMTRDDDYGLSLSRGVDIDGARILQLAVYSACIGNPTDKPHRWGLG